MRRTLVALSIMIFAVIFSQFVVTASEDERSYAFWYPEGIIEIQCHPSVTDEDNVFYPAYITRTDGGEFFTEIKPNVDYSTRIRSLISHSGQDFLISPLILPWGTNAPATRRSWGYEYDLERTILEYPLIHRTAYETITHEGEIIAYSVISISCDTPDGIGSVAIMNTFIGEGPFGTPLNWGDIDTDNGDIDTDDGDTDTDDGDTDTDDGDTDTDDGDTDTDDGDTDTDDGDTDTDDGDTDTDDSDTDTDDSDTDTDDGDTDTDDGDTDTPPAPVVIRNPVLTDPVSVANLRGSGLSVWNINRNQSFSVSSTEINTVTANPDQHTLISSSPDGYYRFYRLSTGELQLNTGPDFEGKEFVTVFNTNGQVVKTYTIDPQ